jgi:hypothetical protein
MNIKEKIIAFSTSLFFLSSILYSPTAYSATYKLSSFNTIRNINIGDEEKEAGIINFNEFLRIYYYNYLSKKSNVEKNRSIVRLNSEINHLKYSEKISNPDREPPVILHWTDANNALGVIRTLFEERHSMTEGIIGVDYVVTEPLLHPDYPDRPARAYAVKFSKSEVATTWFHVPDKLKNKMPEQDRKYNKAINIEIVGWRFLQNNSGKENNFSKNGKLGIRETFNGDFDNFDTNFSIYPTVLKLVNYLAEKYDFGNLVDEYSPENEIDQELKNKKGIIYLNGPLSKYIKGHGLIALEHTLMFGGTYWELRHDFTPEELLVFYEDLKNFRQFESNDMVAKQIEKRLFEPGNLDSLEAAQIKDNINNVKSRKKQEYLLYALYLHSTKIDSIAKLNESRRYIDYLDPKGREKLTSLLLSKYLDESNDIEENDFGYIKSVIFTLKDTASKNYLNQLLFDRFAYYGKTRKSS